RMRGGVAVEQSAPERFIRTRGGAVPIRELDAAGIHRTQLRHAVARNRGLSIRRGWEGVPDAPPPVVARARVGGSLPAASVARLHGLWLLDDPQLHVRVSGNASRL